MKENTKLQIMMHIKKIQNLQEKSEQILQKTKNLEEELRRIEVSIGDSEKFILDAGKHLSPDPITGKRIETPEDREKNLKLQSEKEKLLEEAGLSGPLATLRSLSGDLRR